MSRNKKSIIMQLHRRIDEQIQIGKPKIKMQGRPIEGIHSLKTLDAYRTVASDLGAYCKSVGIKDVKDIDKRAVMDYMDKYRGSSPYTVAVKVSAINKILQPEEHYTPRALGFNERRSYKTIKNNRGEAPRSSTAHLARNQDMIELVRCCGARRKVAEKITPAAAVFGNSGMVIGFEVKGDKGGKNHVQMVLPSCRSSVTSWVRGRINEGRANEPLAAPADKNCPLHRERAEAARNAYYELKEYKDNGRDAFDGRRELFIINEAKYERELNSPRFKNDTIHGFDKEVALQVSYAVLAHERVDVSIYHYLLAK